MAKRYWTSTYQEIKDATKLATYVELATPAVLANGGRFLVLDGQMTTKEAGIEERIDVVEFDSFDVVVATYESDKYKAALEKLEGGVVHDFRILEGVD
jgi:uncharacterized protein (DUF1330 family)